MAVVRICKICNKTFKVPPVRLKTSSCCFCSNTCSALGRTGANNPNWKGGLLSKNCKECGVPFKIKAKEVKKGSGQYCSKKCSAKGVGRINKQRARQKRLSKNCRVCSKKIYVKTSHKDIEGSYCSRVCMAIDYKDRLKKDKNPNYSHGQSGTNNYFLHYNRIYRARKRNAKGEHTLSRINDLHREQKGKCVYCNIDLQQSGYHVDHIIPLARGGSNWASNIQLLCPNCNIKKGAKDPYLWAVAHWRLI